MTRWVLLLLCVLLTACHGPREQVILLPGGTAPLTLTTAQGQTLTLDTPYQTAQALGDGRLDAGITTAESVQARYGAVLLTTPAAGRLFVLSFATGQTTLTPESQAEVPALLAEVARRGAVEVEIAGHTDTVGDLETNDRLSLARAEAVRELLVQAGLRSAFVRVVGRGERALLVQTPDEVDAPQNRRVEVRIR
jgi:outer membrane protein OmpA-like peptidoglycan-associated protein